MIRKNAGGAINMGHEAFQTAIPVRISTMPRYMGLRVKVNGPDKTSAVGSSVGTTGVFIFLNCKSPDIIITIPNNKIAGPIRVSGEFHNL